MDLEPRPVWGIHMGRPGGKSPDEFAAKAESIQQLGYIALGWPQLGDIGQLPAGRDAFRCHFQEHHGYNASERGISAATGMLFRFVHEMKRGDLVVTPSPAGGIVRIGGVASEYRMIRHRGMNTQR